jgi:hypothetical protein
MSNTWTRKILWKVYGSITGHVWKNKLTKREWYKTAHLVTDIKKETVGVGGVCDEKAV